MRAGALAPAAERFLHGWLGDDACAFRGGARGLILLCDHMEHWLGLDAVDAEAERGFVEGAGALLGLLLIDHVGQTAHAAHVARGSVHRLQLGTHGFFDPFAAIDLALDADSVRGELARQVALAEAEAASRGPLSRVVCGLLLALAHKRPDLTLAEHFDLTLWLHSGDGDEPIELDLTRAVESTREQSLDAVHAVIDKLLTMLPGGGDVVLDFVEARTRLVPRLARQESLRELGTGSGALFGKPLTEELVVALLVEYEGRARYVKGRELEAWGVRPERALELALENLSLRSERTRIACTSTDHGPLWVARTGDGRDSARVLLHSLYDALTDKLGARVVVSIPHRDTFFACAGEDEALVQELARRTAHDAARAPHRLSNRLFALRAGGALADLT
ncbi:MAG: hypothetical protein RLZZ450_1069 [Pseudomonadota bacterium]